SSEHGAELVSEHSATAELAGTLDGRHVEGALHRLSIDEPKAPRFLQDGAKRGQVPVGCGRRVELLEAAPERADVLRAELVPGQPVSGDLAATENVGDGVERGPHDPGRVGAEAAQVDVDRVL